MSKLDCLRCSAPMRFLRSDKIQLGQTDWFLGDLPNLVSGALEVSIYVCPSCGKIELFQVEDTAADQSIPQIKCPKCGKMHDFDDPKCPFCKCRLI